jgi:hypothetical protein
MRQRRVRLPILLAPAFVYLAVLLLLGLFVVHPPTLGWIGLGVVATIVVIVAMAASRLLSRARVNAVRLHPHPGSVYRLLLVVERTPLRWQLRAGVHVRVDGRQHEVLAVAPVSVSPLHFVTQDEGENRALAERRLARTLELLHELGVSAEGVVGADDPLQAVGDALARFPADEILIVDGADSRRGWLERGFEQKLRDLFGVHTSRLRRDVAA